METDPVSLKRDRPGDGASSSRGHSPKRREISDVLGMPEEEVNNLIKSGMGETGFQLDPESAGKLLSAFDKLLTLAKDVISGNSSLVMDAVREETRLRSLVITLPTNLPRSASGANEEELAKQKVAEETTQQLQLRTMLKFLGVNEAPKALYRMNAFLWKCELPSRHAKGMVLRNKMKLRKTEKWGNVFIRESLTFEQRQRQKELRYRRNYLNEAGGNGETWQLRGDKLVWKANPTIDRTAMAMTVVIPEGWTSKGPRVGGNGNSGTTQSALLPGNQ